MIDILIRWENVIIFLTLKGPLARKMDIKYIKKHLQEHKVQKCKDALHFSVHDMSY